MTEEREDIVPSLLAIDKDNLDQEWVEHSEKYLDYVLQLEEANSEELDLKVALDVAKAEAEKDIRARPKRYKIAKFTEASVKLEIVLHPLVKKATRRLNKAKHRAGILGAAVKGYEHKKRALEKLVDLHGQGYFAAPRMPKDEFEKGQAKKKKRRAHAD